MSDEQQDLQPVPIHFTQAITFRVEHWPARTSFGPAFLEKPHAYHATISGYGGEEHVSFDIFNGGAMYTLRRDLPLDGENVVADLVEGSDKVTRRRV